MKKLFNILMLVCSLSMLNSCIGEDWFERDPKDMITDDQLWDDPDLVLGLLANYYNRLPQLAGDFNTGGMSEFDDAMWSGHTDGDYHNNIRGYAYDYGNYWDYTFIRDINLSLENLDNYGSGLGEDNKKQFKAELRFIRAYTYFELVKRMGGVPIITTQLLYDGSGDVENLQKARATEAATYDFIYDELEAIKDDFVATKGSRTRANKITALALESRAMLYAGSIAKYNALMSAPITTEGNEVGIPAERADDYYSKSLAASQEIMKDGGYELYGPAGSDAGVNFYNLFMDESVNEVIFAKDYTTGKVHGFTFDNVVRSYRSDTEGSSFLSPSLGLVESFDYLDGTDGELKDVDSNGNYIVYDNINDIFSNKDARLYGTVVYPGSSFRSQAVSMQAGVAIWNDATGRYDLSVGSLGSTYNDGGVLTGIDGPQNNEQYVSNTGFYLRKFVSEDSQYGVRPTLARNWWPWFRLGEVYLNAAEAAFELGFEGDALSYINKVREVHGGFPANSIKTLTNDIIRKERRVELAFEDHRYFDLKRWRIADQVWTGDKSEGSSSVVEGLFAYRIVREGHEDNGKYIFDRFIPTRFYAARQFTMANYYSAIKQSVLDNNPKIVRNPFH
ncbi:RagB/SusD family nutrient uptake outer membrane protein [Geofilum sp. OHC36d9]|uniref:RagB/SusD family nutrient uptake outer membrane protein n=1 Tax=Geofilum sp. OHC36d9 TaxID=3458413 RepID=UPI004033CB6F